MVNVNSVVSRDAEQVAREFQSELEGRDVKGLAFFGLAAAVGLGIAQMVADRVLSALNMSTEPQQPKEFFAAALAQAVGALIVGFAAAQVGGSAILFTGIVALAVGMIVMAGANLLEGLQVLLRSQTSSMPRQTHDARQAQQHRAVADGGQPVDDVDDVEQHDVEPTQEPVDVPESTGGYFA